jgi:hypothetical protein
MCGTSVRLQVPPTLHLRLLELISLVLHDIAACPSHTQIVVNETIDLLQCLHTRVVYDVYNRHQRKFIGNAQEGLDDGVIPAISWP